MKQRLDTYDTLPTGMRRYLGNYGWHFSRKMCEFAVSLMRNKQGKITMVGKDEVDNKLDGHHIKIDNNILYDATYVYNMAASDFLGSSIKSEESLVKYVKDYVDDTDMAEGFILNRFIADCCINGVPIDWEDML